VPRQAPEGDEVANRVFLHVGTPKTGTTFLQSVLWANKEVLKQQGVLLPLNNVRDHYYLSGVARGPDEPLEGLPAAAFRAWERMHDELGRWERDALISHELFAVCSAERAAWTAGQLDEVSHEVHVIVTARDLARQIPAEWQQTIKHGRSHRLGEFYEDLRSPEPTVLFWTVQDLPDLVDRWSTGVPAGRLHLVTVPPAGAPRDLLWQRFAGLIGIDPLSVELPAQPPNESLGAEEVETLRRVNLHPIPSVERSRQQVLVRQVLADGVLAARPQTRRFAPPEQEHQWVVARGTAMVEELRGRDFDVVGDLAELVPPSTPVAGPNPDEVSDSAVARIATETISDLLYRIDDQEIRPLRDRNADLRDRLRATTTRVQQLRSRVITLEGRLDAARRELHQQRNESLAEHLRRRGVGLRRRRRRRTLS
jgi:hypothetical protein